jgi:Xaa-Pro dipeptidase
MNLITPKSELTARMANFREIMDLQNPDWKMAVVFSKINLLYFTGSMPEGMLIVERDNKETLWVRRSYPRTLEESLFGDIRPMEGFRDVALSYKSLPESVFLETEFLPLAVYQRFQKYFPVSTYQSADQQISTLRSVKSSFEVQFMEKAGSIHQKVLEERVPGLLQEGISEVEFAGRLYQAMLEEGHQGSARFNMLDTEMVIGQIGFGTNSLYPTSFNGPGGNCGIGPAAPSMGSRERKLKRGDLVFVDVGLGFNGYHSDKTMTYMFGHEISGEAMTAHHQCVDIQTRIATMLKPGNIPAQIYETILSELPVGFSDNFMGFGSRQVKFLGHGIGLTIDEIPVLAKGFNEPLRENMFFAVEPKKGIPNVGMVGIENTFRVTPQGGKCITGNHPGLMLVS